MARKDLSLMVEEAARGVQTLVMVPTLAALLDAGIAQGEGALDVAAAVRVPGLASGAAPPELIDRFRTAEHNRV